MKILVFGSNGQLGRCLRDSFKSYENIFFSTRAHFDALSKNNLENFLDLQNPQIIINASAYTNVDNANQDPDSARKVNSIFVSSLSNHCKLKNILLIHYSTDFVFDGKSDTPYLEESITNPINEYGYSKLQGENNILSSECKHFIFRTSWVYSAYGKNFLKTMLNKSKLNASLDIVDDQIGCPTSAHELANFTYKVVDDYKKGFSKFGIYHFSGTNQCSWYEFTKMIFRVHKKINKIKEPEIKPISSSKLKFIARRPKYSVLDNSKVKDSFNFTHLGILEAIEDVVIKITD